LRSRDSVNSINDGRVGNSTLIDPSLLLFIKAAVNYDDCEPTTYYSDTDTTSFTSLYNLIKKTHRTVLPYTSSSLDTWDALIDVDGVDVKDEQRFVKLIYKDILVDASDYGTASTWNREHIWPKSRGVGYNGPDFTDIHHLRPADWSVNAARGNRYFANCGVVNPQTECVIPAHHEAPGTADDSTIFLPPPNNRGDVARSLFYMATRYSQGSDVGTEGLPLILSDCPDDHGGGSNKMGYLSQLLQWHIDDPVDDAEMERNGRVCTLWQGNRNPYIDFPELVEIHFGNPKSIIQGEYRYDCSNELTPGTSSLSPNTAPSTPTAPSPTNPSLPTPISPTPSCLSLFAGDIMITGFQSDNPDEVSFVALNDIPGGVKLYLTDNAWTGSKFRINEGTKEFIVPESGLSAGSTFGFGNDNFPYNVNWVDGAGNLALSASGDNLILYCLDNDDLPKFITGLLYTSGGWQNENVDESIFGTLGSARPLSLCSTCSVELSHMDNYVYVGTHTGSAEELRASIADKTNWNGSNARDAISLNSVLEKFYINYSDNIHRDVDKSSKDKLLVKRMLFQFLVLSTMILLVQLQ